MTLENATIVDCKYQVVDLLGEGGMGAVYRAKHLLTEREVALKVLHPGRGEEVQARRFKTEVTVAGKVRHPGIVQVFDAGREDATGRLWFAMEMLEGESLRDLMDDAEADTDRCVRWLVDALDVMVAAHGEGVLHRDLKPENLFVERREEGPDRLRVVDFGIARDLARPSHTTTGSAVGTAHYMAPEQATAKRGIGPAVDVWAFGVMLYECLSGELPFDGPSVHAVVVEAVTEPHRPLAELRPDLPETWWQLVDACLAKDPACRMGAEALRDSLRVLLDDGGDLAPIFELERRPLPPRSERVELAETIEAQSVLEAPAASGVRAAAPGPEAKPVFGWWALGAALLLVPSLGVLGWLATRDEAPEPPALQVVESAEPEAPEPPPSVERRAEPPIETQRAAQPTPEPTEAEPSGARPRVETTHGARRRRPPPPEISREVAPRVVAATVERPAEPPVRRPTEPERAAELRNPAPTNPAPTNPAPTNPVLQGLGDFDRQAAGRTERR